MNETTAKHALNRWVSTGCHPLKKGVSGFELPNTGGEFLCKLAVMNLLIKDGFATKIEDAYFVTAAGKALFAEAWKSKNEPKVRAEKGDVMLHVVPPYNGIPGYSQPGVVTAVTDTTLELSVREGMVRLMRFSVVDGTDTTGLGSFVIFPTSLN